MSADGVRLLQRGVQRPVDGRRMAIVLVLVMFLPIFSPTTADVSVGRDDFGVLDAMADALNQQALSGEDERAKSEAEAVLDAVVANGRLIGEGDALLATDGVLGQITMRDTTPLEPDHPRPYTYLTDNSTHPEGWPNDLIETLFDLPPSFSDPLAVGANTYSIYVNYSARDDGPQYEAWDYGTFTGDIISFEGTGIFDNAIDLDGDGSNDIGVGLSIAGMGEQGEGWDIIWSNDLIPIVESIWIRPNFQWRVHVLDHSNPMWDDMATMEVSMMKGFAYDLSIGQDNGESYALVIDSRFTEPPHDFRTKVGLDQMDLAITDTLLATLAGVLSIFTGGTDESSLEVMSVTAPYSIIITNPDSSSANEQTDCMDGNYYDTITDHDAESRDHKCGYSVGIGYVHFDAKDEATNNRPVMEMGYVDVALHPVIGSSVIPSEVDLVLRNDNVGDNSFDTIEIYSDVTADLWFHYFEDRSNHIEAGGKLGNITDSRGWIRGLPHGTLPAEEINAIFTMIGEAPDSVNLPGDIPDRLSLIVAIKNFTADATTNTYDASLIVDPTDERWNSLILIAGTERIAELEYVSTFQRHGYVEDSSSLLIRVEDLPEVIIVLGTFEIPASNRVRVEFGTAPDLLSELLDNIVLNLVEIVLDIGTILNGLPEAIVGTAGTSSGEILLNCYNQVKSAHSDGSTRMPDIASFVSISVASSDQPVIPGDHIILAEDNDNQQVDGRYGPEDPLVPVAMSLTLTNVSAVGYSYDQISDDRKITLDGRSNETLVIGHLNHSSGTTEGKVRQFATISNRPDTLLINQIGTNIYYTASGPIGTITYSGEGDGQYNALRLVGLPSEFSLELGDTLGFTAEQGVDEIVVQISNATEPLTMDGDHIRFWVDENSGEASMSMRISDITRINQYPPDEPGSRGTSGNSRFEMERTGSSPFGILLEDVSVREDEFMGLSGRAHLNPLPANISFSLPTSQNSQVIQIPDFGESNGVLSLSFFLGGMIEFGASINDFALQSMVNLGDTSNERTNMTLGIDLVTDEEFDLVLDITKGVNLDEKPRWVHGISAEVLDATQLVFNYSRMPTFTQTSRETVAAVLEDFRIEQDEISDITNAFEWAGLNQTEILIESLADGYVSVREWSNIDHELLEEEGLTLEQRRSWQSKIWMPSLPAGRINLAYDLVVVDDVPTFQITAQLEQYKPERPVLTIEVHGLSRTDTVLKLDGLNTEMSRDVILDAVFTTDADRVIPRTNIDMTYDIGERMNTAHVLQNNHIRGIRTEMMIFDAPRKVNLSATIGDVLIADLVVPPEYRIGVNAADSLILQQLRKVDDIWWPSTMFIHDVPGEMHLDASPASDFDIDEIVSFQGMFELDYRSNSDEMDLFLETKGKAQNIKSNNLMLAENLPDIFVMETTDEYGVRISASGNGVEKLYLRRSDTPMRPGLTLVTAEVVGEDLKSADVHIKKIGGYPIIILDGISSGRIVATAHAEAEVGDYTIDGRGVLLDAQFTGGIPTASSMGVNGVVTDLSLIGSLTGEKVDTTHIMIAEPITTLIATGVNWVVS